MIGIAAGALAVVSVAWRRTAPALACVTVLAGGIVHEALGGGQHFQLGAFVLVMNYYMLGRRSAERKARIVIGLLVVAPLLGSAIRGSGFLDVVTPWLFFMLLPFGAGRVLGGHAVLTEQLRVLTQELEHEQHARVRRAAGDERTRVARELHDIVAHSVSVMVIQAVAAGTVADRDPRAAHDALTLVQSCGREALSEMRRLVGVLRAGEVDDGIGVTRHLSDLNALADRARAAGLPVEVHIAGDTRRLSPGVELAVYRVVQEALTNAIKHAGPARAEVRVRCADRAVELEITDTGRGPERSPGSPGSGNGLIGMRERVAVYGGELRAGARPAGGFQVCATIPIADQGPGVRSSERRDVSVSRRRWAIRADDHRADWLLAVALLIACEVDLALNWHHRGSPVGDGLLLAALAVPIALRRRAPLLIALGVMVLACVDQMTPIGRINLNAPQFVLFIPPYTIAAYTQRREAVAGLAALFGCLLAFAAISHGNAVGVAFGFGMCSASWAMGRAVRARRQLADRLTHTARLIAAEREDRVRLVVAHERTRIARELEAVVARSVSTMVVQSAAAERLLASDPAGAQAAIAVIERTGCDALSEMRHILGVLRAADQAADLTPQPGVGQLHALIEHARRNGRMIVMQVRGEPRPLPAGVDLGLYRILQEALANPDHTGGAAEVVLNFEKSDVSLDVTVTRPAAADWPTPTMRERVALGAGSVDIETAEPTTQRLRIRMPAPLEATLA